MSIASIYAAGKVRRWHMNPTLADTAQTNADHQGGCVRLLLMLHPDPSVRLIRAVAHHDDGERWAGDVSSDAKRADPALAEHLARVERKALTRELGRDVYGELSDDEAHWLHLVDRLEAYAHVAIHRPAELQANGWPAARANLIRYARAVDASADVASFLHDMDARCW